MLTKVLRVRVKIDEKDSTAPDLEEVKGAIEAAQNDFTGYSGGNPVSIEVLDVV